MESRHTLGKLFEVLQYSGQPGVLHKEDFSALNTGGIPRGEITVEVIFDPPGHNRLPIEDDEIIDQLVIVQPMTPSGITFVTYDTGQALRAREAGLKVLKLDKPEEEPPGDVDGAAVRGRQRRKNPTIQSD
jgi:hypothetical protein